jgi:hypothetical protein
LNKALSLKSFVTGDEDEVVELPKPGSLVKRLNQRIDDMVEDGRTREDVVKALASEAMATTEEVDSILSGTGRPSTPQLKAFARVLDVPFETLKNLHISAKTIKDLFEGMLSESPSRWELDACYAGMVTNLVQVAQASKATGTDFDLEGKLNELGDVHNAHVKAFTLEHAHAYLDSESDEPFYLRAMGDPSMEDFISAKHVDIEDHVALVVSALRSIAARFRLNNEARIKAGRQLSEKNRNRLTFLEERTSEALSDQRQLLEETQPKATDAEKRLAQTVHLRQQWRMRHGANTDANLSASTG